MSILFVIGKYAGFQIECKPTFLRIVIGWFAVWILLRDFEQLFDDVCSKSGIK